VYDVDQVGLLTRELLRERTRGLVAEACAWSVGMSDQQHRHRRGGRLTTSGSTLGLRATLGQQLGVEDDVHLELGDARPGSFQDALAALTPDGTLYADRLDQEVLTPFVLQTCVDAVVRFRSASPAAWQELLDELGEGGDDLPEVVRAAEWEAPLKILAEQLVLAALGDQPLVEVEAEGLPLSLVRAAEAETRRAVPQPVAAPPEEDLAGALFLAEAALQEAGLPVPVPVTRADALLDLLLGEGLEAQEVLAVLPQLPVHQETAEMIGATLEVLRAQGLA
jgi:hypothetical protein